jgi:hypothetical protein
MDVFRCPHARPSESNRRRPSPVAMRSVKSVISGFGVAISLVSAAACAFFITAALVAFNGAGDLLAADPTPSNVLTASVAREAPIVIGPAASQPAARVAPVAARAVREPRSSTVIAVTRTSSPKTVVDPPHSSQQSSAVAQQPPPAAKPSATAPLAETTSGLAKAVAGVVTDATTSLGKTVAPISPALGGTLAGVGSGLANGVVSVGDVVAAVIDALGTHAAAPQG